MELLFFIFLSAFFLLAAAFIGAAWVKQEKRHWALPACLLLALATFSGLGYFSLGRWEHVVYQQDDVALRQIATLLEDTVSIDSVLKEKIAKELKQQRSRPGAQPSVWILEGQLALLHQDYAAAKRAYQEAYEYAPEDEDIAVSYAQAWYLAQGKVDPELAQFLQELENHYPEQAGLLNLLAVIAYNAHDYKHALRYWQQLLPQYPANSIEAEVLEQAIKDAKQH